MEQKELVMEGGVVGIGINLVCTTPHAAPHFCACCSALVVPCLSNSGCISNAATQTN